MITGTAGTSPPAQTDCGAYGKALVLQQFSPRVAVATTPDVSALLQRLHCASMSDLLTPFATVEKAVVHDMSSGLQQSLYDFRIRFAEINKLEESLTPIADELLNNAVRTYHDPGNRPDTVDGKVVSLPTGTNLDELTPWYAAYRKWFLKLFTACEHETFDHPVACIYFVMSDNPDPLTALSKLYNNASTISPFDRGWMDLNVLEYNVLVHDERSSSTQNVDDLFQRMKRSFGLHCHLLRINAENTIPTLSAMSDLFNPPVLQSSILSNYWAQNTRDRVYIATCEAQINKRSSETTKKIQDDIDVPSAVADSATLNSTSPSLIDAPAGAGIDANLTIGPSNVLALSDITVIRAMIRELVIQSLIPYMERNMQRWNEQVASSRRGLTGRFFQASKKYFGSSSSSSGSGNRTSNTQQQQTTSTGRNSSPSGSNSIVYPCTSSEAQLRKLADFAFMLRDYKFAASIYDTIRKDFFADKAWKHYASAMEMFGLCHLCMDIPVNMATVEHAFDQAIIHYQSRCLLPQFATRTTILYYELLRGRNAHKQAAPLLIRMTTDDSDLQSALLLEQAALCFIGGGQPVKAMSRKYMFHTLLAGHRFGKCGQRQHCIRCYLLVLKLYGDRAWKLIRDHIVFTLARQSFHISELRAAVDYSIQLLRPGGLQSASQQSSYLKEFMYIYTTYMSSVTHSPALAFSLSVPEFEEAHAHIILANNHPSDVRSSQTLTAVDVQDSMWRSMEEHLEQVMFNTNGDNSLGLSRGSNVRRLVDLGEMVVGAVGEEAYLSIEVHNPLSVVLSINGLRAICEYKPSGRPGSPMFTAENTADFIDMQSESEVVLEPLSTETLLIRLTPKMEGQIMVTGLEYYLHGTVPCRKQFMKKGGRLNQTSEQRQGVVYAPDQTLTLVVNSPMPLLDVAVHGIPDVMLAGEIVRCSLEITNKGAKAMTNLRVNVSHPAWVVLGDQHDMDQTGFGETLRNQCHSVMPGKLLDYSVISVPLPRPDTSADGEQRLDADSTTLIPIWLRCDRSGKQQIRFLFAYQAAEGSLSVRNCRVHRFVVGVNVISALAVNAVARPSAHSLNDATLSLEVENTQGSLNVFISQIVVCSTGWTLHSSILAQDRTAEGFDVPARQTICEYLCLKRCSDIQDYALEKYTAHSLRRFLIGDATFEATPEIHLTYSSAAFCHNFDPASEPLKSFLLQSQTQFRRTFLADTFPGIGRAKLADHFTLFNTDDVAVAIYWSTSSMESDVSKSDASLSPRFGVTYVFGTNLSSTQNPIPPGSLAIGPSKALFSSTLREKAVLVASLTKNRHLHDDCPLRVIFINPSSATISGATITGMLKVVNTSWFCRIAIDLELVLTVVGSTSPAWSFLGQTKHSAELAPSATIEIPITVQFNRPGVHDIGRWTIRGRLLTVNRGGVTEGENTAFQVGRMPTFVEVY